MIKLTKGPEPLILQRNAAAWLKLLEDKVAAGQVPTDTEKSRYRHSEIKTALKAETHGKCAYCESRLIHVAFGDVEHIAPKSLKLADTFRWENLTLACDVCNTFKKDAVGVIDPYADEPGEHLKFVGPMVYAYPHKMKGIITTKQLRLNRPELVESRSRRLESISNILLTISTVTDIKIKAVLAQDLIENEASDESEYAAFVRSFLAIVDPNLVDFCGKIGSEDREIDNTEASVCLLVDISEKSSSTTQS